jgi:hypothetical protein
MPDSMPWIPRNSSSLAERFQNRTQLSGVPYAN